MARDQEIITIIGLNGTGKSVTTKKLVNTWKQTNPFGKVIAWDPQFQFQDICNFNISPQADKWDQSLNATNKNPKDNSMKSLYKITDSLIVLDDFRSLHGKNHTTDELKKFFINRRVLNNEMIISVHSPKDVLEGTKAFVTKYIFFYTQSQEIEYKNKLQHPELCIAASSMVNNYYTMYKDEIFHPNDPRYTGQTFPFAIFDLKTRKVSFNNMNKTLIINGKKL